MRSIFSCPQSLRAATVILFVALYFCASRAVADVTQNNFGGGYGTAYYSGPGHSASESFTAVDANIGLVAFKLIDTNNAGAGDLVYNILQGDGLSGSLVASRSSSGPPINTGFSGFFDLDFSGTTLTVGQKYTLQMLVPSPRWAVYYSTSDVYSGTSYTAGTPSDDFTFHVLAVPEPSTLALLALLVRTRK